MLKVPMRPHLRDIALGIGELDLAPPRIAPQTGANRAADHITRVARDIIGARPEVMRPRRLRNADPAEEGDIPAFVFA
jgi:hypothetical protein